mmetsp:Transcript_27678/g.47922  ORF Transcript_27678/g.47922 Transcript_27678/m.47922 type:complete len:221 (-) Transcript_27678:170-832(-)
MYLLTKVVALPRSILKRTEAKVEHHFPARVPKQRVPEPFPLIEPIGLLRDLVRLVREDHGHLHLSWEAGGGEVSRFVKPAVAHHDLAHDGKDAEELHQFLPPIERRTTRCRPDPYSTESDSRKNRSPNPSRCATPRVRVLRQGPGQSWDCETHAVFCVVLFQHVVMMEGWELLESTMVLQWRFSNGTPSSLLSLLRSFRAGGTMSQSSPRSSVFPYCIVF